MFTLTQTHTLLNWIQDTQVVLNSAYLGWGAAVSFGSEETVKLAANDSERPSILTQKGANFSRSVQKNQRKI